MSKSPKSKSNQSKSPKSYSPMPRSPKSKSPKLDIMPRRTNIIKLISKLIATN